MFYLNHSPHAEALIPIPSPAGSSDRHVYPARDRANRADCVRDTGVYLRRLDMGDAQGQSSLGGCLVLLHNQTASNLFTLHFDVTFCLCYG